MSSIELFYNKENNTYVIREGDGILQLTEKEFNNMKQDGRSPLLLKLYKQAKKERHQQ